MLYPTELLGHISKIFNFPAQTDSNELPLRRRPLYPTELRGLIQKIFNFLVQQDSNELPLRRRTLYPGEVRGRVEEIFSFAASADRGLPDVSLSRYVIKRIHRNVYGNIAASRP